MWIPILVSLSSYMVLHKKYWTNVVISKLHATTSNINSNSTHMHIFLLTIKARATWLNQNDKYTIII
jgi:hypothetical protein